MQCIQLSKSWNCWYAIISGSCLLCSTLIAVLLICKCKDYATISHFMTSPDFAKWLYDMARFLVSQIWSNKDKRNCNWITSSCYAAFYCLSVLWSDYMGGNRGFYQQVLAWLHIWHDDFVPYCSNYNHVTKSIQTEARWVVIRCKALLCQHPSTCPS